MADPTNVYEITFEVARQEQEVLEALGGFRVLQAKRLGTAGRQRKWSVVIQHKGSKQATRDRLRELRGVQRVRLLE